MYYRGLETIHLQLLLINQFYVTFWYFSVDLEANIMLYRSAVEGCFISMNLRNSTVYITPYFHINRNGENNVFFVLLFMTLFCKGYVITANNPSLSHLTSGNAFRAVFKLGHWKVNTEICSISCRIICLNKAN